MEQKLIEAISSPSKTTLLIVSPEFYAGLVGEDFIDHVGDDIWYNEFRVLMCVDINGDRVLVANG